MECILFYYTSKFVEWWMQWFMKTNKSFIPLHFNSIKSISANAGNDLIENWIERQAASRSELFDWRENNERKAGRPGCRYQQFIPSLRFSHFIVAALRGPLVFIPINNFTHAGVSRLRSIINWWMKLFSEINFIPLIDSLNSFHSFIHQLHFNHLFVIITVIWDY